MSPDPIPDQLSVPLAAMIDMTIEHWRITTWLDGVLEGRPSSSAVAPARHALRRIEDFLRANELSSRSLDGHPFDPGLAVRVVDTMEDPSLPAGKVVIAETISPMVLWRGHVVKSADVVTRNGVVGDL